mmetsp:Transcript_9535/g.22485  ORF Transcript_9535/g.22485 Transcript_9535/m.22485 type:complete len:948 (-) Transcript_9535:75-2918(-)
MVADTCDLWQVVGGASKGGIIVRADKDTASQEFADRLITGALVRTLEHDIEAQRLHYEKITGEGPTSGWVSTSFKGKNMLATVAAEQVEEVLAMKLYCQRFGQSEDEGARYAWNRKAFGWNFSRDSCEQDGESVRAELERNLKHCAPCTEQCVPADLGLPLCSHCRLPVGEVAYAMKDAKHTLTHAECLAQLVLRELLELEKALELEEAATKKQRREEYDIGWKVERIPESIPVAARLQDCHVARGMCCVVINPETGMATVAPTVQPSAAVNLEYLAIALQVRRHGNREPVFSLDPTDPANAKDCMQVKRFEPAWLAGTSVGEVLFQADYHLKELSMGEYEQPVIGMKSCHDLSDGDQQDKWSAREWFIVRKAEIQMTDDNVLLPLVKLGVEAREQVLGHRGLEDVRTTRQDHPLVRYADSFTHNFDLIAERKSVVFQLRELAKASVVAKFLLESDIGLEQAWFSTANETEEAYCLEIPQLWNERCRSHIQVQDGKIVNSDTSFDARLHRLYGGVQFGLDKFQLSGARQPARLLSAGLAARQFVQPARHLSATLSAGLATRQFQRSFGPVGVAPARVSAGVGLDKFALAGTRQPARLLSAGLAARQFVQPARHLSATLSAGLATRQFQRSFGPVGVQPSRVAGVDLNLDEFNLSAATRVESSAQLAEGVDISSAFWTNLWDESGSMLGKEERNLLKCVFHPSLSDRRSEGNRFVPPDNSFAYVQGLHALVTEEEQVRELRKQDFCATSFDREAPGLHFPSSWRSSVKVLQQEASRRALTARPGYKAQAEALKVALQDASPAFDKSTEDGTRFRIYKIGSLEVRTTQDLDSAETVAAVFSACAPAGASKARPQALRGEEKIEKATEYVEGSCGEPRSYIVLETESKSTIVVEHLKQGTVKREVNPIDLEDRNSLAKVLRSSCAQKKVTVQQAMQLQGDIFGQVCGKRA